MTRTETKLRIGPIVVSFRIDDPGFARSIYERYRGFSVTTTAADIRFTCRFSAARRRGNGGEQLTVHTLADGTRVVRRADAECRWLGARGTLDGSPSVYTFDACLRGILATVLPAKGALLVHAAAVCSRNKAFVFPGVSGAGKSTLSRLAGRRRVLNDEIVVVAVGKGRRVRVGATPFWGELGTGPASRRSFGVAALLYPVKDRNGPRLSDVQHGDSLQQLLRCVCTFSRRRDDMAEILSNAVSVVGSVPSYHLHFRKDGTFWPLLEAIGG